MIRFKTQLVTVDDVKKFVRSASAIPTEVWVTEGRTQINGKSIMSMFSLNLSNPITVEISAEKYLNAFSCKMTDITEEDHIPEHISKLKAILNKYEKQISEEDMIEALDMLLKIKENR